jgi:cytochrome c oxidase subunit IV
MGHHVTTVKEDLGVAIKGFIILLIVTFIEVGLALVGNGHIIEGFTLPKILFMIPIMIAFSLYKAYYIVSIFMHLGHETKGMAASIVLPMLLFVWAITAFLWEGSSWNNNRNYVKNKNKEGLKINDKVDGKTTYYVPVDKLNNCLRFS